MIADKTKIIRKITDEERANFYSEIQDHLLPWTLHYHNHNTALKEGKTLHVYDIDESGTQIIQNALSLFPFTVSFISSVMNIENLGRCYWHCLQPGEKINLHNDLDVVNKFQNRLLKRYQVYLDLSDNFELLLDGTKVQIPSEYSNSLIDFDLRQSHFYKNTNDQIFYLLVFDKFKYSN